MTVNQLEKCHACTNPVKEFCNSTPELCGRGMVSFSEQASQRAIKTICNADFNVNYAYTRANISFFDVIEIFNICEV